MKSSHVAIEDIEETEEAIFQRSQLSRIREFMVANEASQALVDAIDVALEDIERWVDSSIETAMGSDAPKVWKPQARTKGQ